MFPPPSLLELTTWYTCSFADIGMLWERVHLKICRRHEACYDSLKSVPTSFLGSSREANSKAKALHPAQSTTKSNICLKCDPTAYCSRCVTNNM